MYMYKKGSCVHMYFTWKETANVSTKCSCSCLLHGRSGIKAAKPHTHKHTLVHVTRSVVSLSPLFQGPPLPFNLGTDSSPVEPDDRQLSDTSSDSPRVSARDYTATVSLCVRARYRIIVPLLVCEG